MLCYLTSNDIKWHCSVFRCRLVLILGKIKGFSSNDVCFVIKLSHHPCLPLTDPSQVLCLPLSQVGEIRVWWAKLGYLNYLEKFNVFTIIPLHIFSTFLVPKLPKGIPKILHKNYDLKTSLHNFIGENIEKWAKLGYLTLPIGRADRIELKIPYLYSGLVLAI